RYRGLRGSGLGSGRLWSRSLHGRRSLDWSRLHRGRLDLRLVGLRLLDALVAARASAAGTAALARTSLAAATGAASALPHRAEALAVLSTAAPALAGGTETLE